MDVVIAAFFALIVGLFIGAAVRDAQLDGRQDREAADLEQGVFLLRDLTKSDQKAVGRHHEGHPTIDPHLYNVRARNLDTPTVTMPAVTA